MNETINEYVNENENELKEITYNISTITMSLKIPDCELNLYNIGRYIDIDNDILGIKYHYGNSSIIKGKYITCIYKKSKNKKEHKINKRLFYNQVSLIIKNKDNIVNTKIFGNGSLHLTGVKDVIEGEEIIEIIIKKFNVLKMKSANIFLIKDNNGIYLDNNNNIYSNKSIKSIIGFKLNFKIYVINKKEYYISKIGGNNVFISNKLESKKTRNILNINGELIGYSQIILLKNKKKLYNNNSNINFDNDFIFYENNGVSTIIGHIVYHVEDIFNINEDDYIEYNYQCNPYIVEPNYDIKNVSTLVNTINIYFKLGFELNRQRLYNELKKTYIVEYTPEKYSGVKLLYKKNINYTYNNFLTESTTCDCDNKCTCNNITFLIFQSGNVIVTGFKSQSDIKDILDNFKNVINNILPIIKKKTFYID